MRENRLSGSEGGVPERASLPLSPNGEPGWSLAFPGKPSLLTPVNGYPISNLRRPQ